MDMIAGVSVKTLAETYGTPLFVYDEGKIRDIMRIYTEQFRSDSLKTGVLYASKAFSCKAILRLANEYGFCLDVVSGGELYTAIQAGFPAEKIYFHGNNKTMDELRQALDAKIGTIVVDNLYEAELLRILCEETGQCVHTLLRVNPGIEAHTHHYIVTAHVDSKFGISFVNEDELVETIRVLQGCEKIVFDGLHAHIGSQIFDRQAFAEEIRKLFAYADHLKQSYQIDVKVLNFGGGFGARYTEQDVPIPTDEVCRMMVEICEEENRRYGNRMEQILIEPGRSIVAEAGYTIYTIGAIKKTPNKLYAFVDGGMADNIRPALYSAEYDAFIYGKETEAVYAEYTIAGKCCESGDILIQKIALPKAEPGDLLVMKTTGAYGYSMASHYNKLLLPAVVFAENGNHRCVIRRETYEHMTALED